MSRRLFAAIAVVALGLSPWSTVGAYAQERLTENAALDLSSVKVVSIGESMRTGALDQRSFPIAPAPRPRKSPILNSLYATTALMQGLDVHSTMRALDLGAVEANPLMAGLTKNKAAFIASKALVATGTIFAARTMAKRNKVAAIITLVALNSAYGMVVQHNYKVARRLR